MRKLGYSLPNLNRRIRCTTDHPEWLASEIGAATGRSVTVGVVDSGWSRLVDDSRVLPGIAIAPSRDGRPPEATHDDIGDVLGHGTACSDVVLRVASNVTILPIRVFSSEATARAEQIASAIDVAIEAGVQVVNLSLGTTDSAAAPKIYRACARAVDRNVIVVAAANVRTGWSYPAVFDNVIGVSTGECATDYEFNYEKDAAVEIRGSGRIQWALSLDGVYRPFPGGSSLAAPAIAGIVALLKEGDPCVSLQQVRVRLEELSCGYRKARDCHDGK